MMYKNTVRKYEIELDYLHQVKVLLKKNLKMLIFFYILQFQILNIPEKNFLLYSDLLDPLLRRQILIIKSRNGGQKLRKIFRLSLLIKELSQKIMMI